MINGSNGPAGAAQVSEAPAEAAGAAQGLSPEVAEKLKAARAQVATAFSQVVMSLMTTARYRHQDLADLEWLVLEPLLRNQIAIASAKPAEGGDASLAGLAFWASVSDEVGSKIEEQIRSGTFPVKLKPEEWNGGDQVWLLDVVAPNRKLATAVLASFGQVAKERPVRIHPIVSRMVDPELLKKLGAERVGKPGEAGS